MSSQNKFRLSIALKPILAAVVWPIFHNQFRYFLTLELSAIFPRGTTLTAKFSALVSQNSPTRHGIIAYVIKSNFIWKINTWMVKEYSSRSTYYMYFGPSNKYIVISMIELRVTDPLHFRHILNVIWLSFIPVFADRCAECCILSKHCVSCLYLRNSLQNINIDS